MAAVKAALLCVAAALMCATIRAQRPEMAVALSLAAGTIALIWALPYVREAAEGALAMARGANLPDGAMRAALQASGIALITEFARQLCEDAGERALAERAVFCGRASLLAMSVPLMSALIARLGALAAP